MVYIITGKSGSGKTTLPKELKKKNYETISTDDVVSYLYEKNNLGYESIKNTLGEEFVNSKTVDKVMLSKALKEKKISIETLNDLIHPLVYDEIIKKKFDFIECPIISSFKNFPLEYKTIELQCSDEISINRLVEGRNFNEDHAKFIVSLYKLPNKIDYIYDNSNELNIDNFLEKIKE